MNQQVSLKVYRLFLSELERHLHEAHEQLIDRHEPLSQESALELGRTFHTIKGGAGFLGFDEVAARAGKLDYLLRKSGDHLMDNLAQVQSLLGELEEVARALPELPKEQSGA